MLFYKASNIPTPAMTDYNSTEARMRTLRRASYATIGDAPRFAKQYNKEFVKTTTHQYQVRASLTLKKAPKGGTIGNAARFKRGYIGATGPGVGDYEIGKFKRLHKASETTFDPAFERYPGKVRA